MEEKLTYESAVAELEKTVARLEEAGVPLEETLALFSRSSELIRFCEEELKRAEAKIQAIRIQNGKETVVDFKSEGDV